jgi:hypothetical protein
MCDCYGHKCESCENVIAVHIADFCTDRENLKVYCPDCLDAIPETDANAVNVFFSKVEDPEVIMNEKWKRVHRSYIGKIVVFICSDKKAHGIYLNG